MTTSQPMSQWPSDHEYSLPVRPGPDIVKITIDGREAEVPNGQLLITAAERHGTYIPRFCYHERMKPVGMCRMCLVEVEGLRGLQISCATPVYDGMVVHTTTDAVRTAQDGVLEFLLINHPLDCPVCDRGGECPLQDQTLAFGPGESRFVEEKRHWPKPIPISSLVMLDRERCIQCGRCTRFADEIVGDPLIDFGGRSMHTEVITFPDEPFRDHFSGNTVQICPVGALTATPYRFRARPWDLETAETTCVACAVGCRGALQSSTNRLVRLLGVDSEPVNHGWLCDKGRYGYEWVHSPARVRTPRVRRQAKPVDVSWPEALDAAADGLRRVLDTYGPEGIAVLGGARGTNEDAYAWTRFAKGVLRTDNVDCQLGDGLPAEVVLGLPRAVIADCDEAAGVVVVAGDLREELPVLHLRLRRAVTELGVPLVELTPRHTGLTGVAAGSIRYVSGELGEAAAQLTKAFQGERARKEFVDAVAPMRGRAGDVVVVLGRANVAGASAEFVDAAATLAALPGVRFLSALRRGNVHGALDLGMAPGFLPGRVSLASGREQFETAWGGVPAQPGFDATAALMAAADSRVRALVLVGADPLADFPDRALARRALDGVDFIVAVGAFVGDAATRADVFLPVSVWGEQRGTTSNLEGRVQRVAPRITPEGTTMESWRIACELALRFGSEIDLETVDEVQNEMARVAPAFAGVDAALLDAARDGAVLPIADHPAQLVFLREPVAPGVSWEPIRPGTSHEEAGAAAAATAAVEASGTGSHTTIKPGLTGAGLGARLADPSELPRPALPLYRWDLSAPRADSVGRDAYSLRLVAGHVLYDGGRMVQETPALAALASGPELLVNRRDRDRLGVGDGDRVRVTSKRASIELAVRADAATPPGCAFIAFNEPGSGAADLIDATLPVTDLRLETL
jgi:NADH-quinone oxidoreductase subunit G